MHVGGYASVCRADIIETRSDGRRVGLAVRESAQSVFHLTWLRCLVSHRARPADRLSMSLGKSVAEIRYVAKMAVPLLILTGRTTSCVPGRNL